MKRKWLTNLQEAVEALYPDSALKSKKLSLTFPEGMWRNVEREGVRLGMSLGEMVNFMVVASFYKESRRLTRQAAKRSFVSLPPSPIDTGFKISGEFVILPGSLSSQQKQEVKVKMKKVADLESIKLSMNNAYSDARYEIKNISVRLPQQLWSSVERIAQNRGMTVENFVSFILFFSAFKG